MNSIAMVFDYYSLLLPPHFIIVSHQTPNVINTNKHQNISQASKKPQPSP
jgi:hypothetical protein